MKTIFVIFSLLSVASCRILQPKQNIFSKSANEDRWMHPEVEERTVKLRNTEELKSEYWLNTARNVVDENIHRKENKNVAKNLIMFMGDGLSIATITAARSYADDDGTRLAFEKFPYTGMASTYCVDRQVADSACTATAYLCGAKANYETIGVTASVPLNDCTRQNVPEFQVSSIADWAMHAGKAAGFVTTTRVTHASPAGVYAHIGHREWEADVNLGKCDPNETIDIARQLIRGEVGPKLKVVLGGGRREFIDESVIDEEGTKGKRQDGLNLINEWRELKGDRGTYVWNKTALLDIDPEKTEYLLGLFESDHCKYNLEVLEEGSQEMEPTLTEMTEKAIDVLSNEENGYFLFVEGGRIDHGHHDMFTRLALDETEDFSKTIAAIVQKVNLEETLIVVTADHSHAFSFAGYPDRDADILGTVGNANDGMSYYILSYANGLGYNKHVKPDGGRMDPVIIEEDRKSNIKHEYPSMAPRKSETHGGDDVSVYAIGPWSHLFTGSYEQHVIPHMMAYAACIGNGLKACD